MKTCLALLLLLLPAMPAPAQDAPANRLADSPRHHEWVQVPVDGRLLHVFVAYPERDTATTAVLVIHENRGLTDWVRSFADQLAEAGYLALAPDLLSGFDADHDRTTDFENADAARNALYELDPGQVTRDLRAAGAYAAALPAATGRLVVAGFCWGGAQAFRLATNTDGLSAALVFYGSPPAAADIPNVAAPVYGFYGEDDERINATIPETERLMAAHGKTYAYEIYPGAGHAFMRRGDDPDGSPENRQARDAAWARLLRLLSNAE